MPQLGASVANDGGIGGGQDAARTPGIQGTGESVTSALVGFKYGILFLEIPPLKLLAFSSLSGLSFPHARTLREKERERERERTFPVWGWKRTRVLGRAALFETHPCFLSTDNGLSFFFFLSPFSLLSSFLSPPWGEGLNSRKDYRHFLPPTFLFFSFFRLTLSTHLIFSTRLSISLSLSLVVLFEVLLSITERI